ncbi:DUF933 domain-containing protein [bacterium]|nr:DUF933 domain-containing protein [bacterium]
MEIAIIGLPQSGKSTLFQIMTGIKSSEVYGETCIKGFSKIPDRRFDKLVEIFKPQKITPASVPFLDISASGEKAWNVVRQEISGVDALIHVVNVFDTKNVDEIIKRYQKLSDEMVFADLMVVENRIGKLNKLPVNALKAEEKIQKDVFPRIKDELEAGKTIRKINLNDSEWSAIKSFAFLTLKPELVVLNISENVAGLEEKFKSLGATVIAVCCQTELEISELDTEDRLDFLNDLGISTPAFELVIQSAFALLGRIYYFTVGEDEVRAWVIKKGSTAPRAAAAIHADFERGFIKAEVVSYDDFMNFGKDLGSVKSAGKLRLEGKDYIVQDGDIISFRFNV